MTVSSEDTFGFVTNHLHNTVAWMDSTKGRNGESVLIFILQDPDRFGRWGVETKSDYHHSEIEIMNVGEIYCMTA